MKIIHVASNPLRESSFLSNLALISISESAFLVEIAMILGHAQMSVTRDLSSGSPSSYNSGSKLVDGLGIAGIVVAVITAIAGILALFKGWKCWERRNNSASSLEKYNSQCDKKIYFLYYLANQLTLLESLE